MANGGHSASLSRASRAGIVLRCGTGLGSARPIGKDHPVGSRSPQTAARAIHPFHAVLLSSAVALFLGRFLEPSRRRDEMKRLSLVAALSMLAGGCGNNRGADPAQFGSNPQLPNPERGLLPTMKIANPTPWGNQRPQVPEGYTITAIA